MKQTYLQASYQFDEKINEKNEKGEYKFPNCRERRLLRGDKFKEMMIERALEERD